MSQLLLPFLALLTLTSVFIGVHLWFNCLGPV